MFHTEFDDFLVLKAAEKDKEKDNKKQSSNKTQKVFIYISIA